MSVSATRQLKKTADNPRWTTDDKLERLNENLTEYGSLDGIVYNVLHDELVTGNQRTTVFNLKNATIEYVERHETPQSDGTIAYGYIIVGNQKFPYREVNWDKDKHRRAVIVANTHAGSWDSGVLSESWGDVRDEWVNDVSFDTEGVGDEKDYSEKNKEVDIDELEEDMTFKLKMSKDEYFDLQERLNVVCAKQGVETMTQAVFELLNFYERHGSEA